MATECYAQVRGSALRVTRLTDASAVTDPVEFATSTSVASVRVNEVSESSTSELIRNEVEQGQVYLTRPAETIRHTVDIDFLRCDPGVFHLTTGVKLVTNAQGDIVGFDEGTRTPVVSFALEVWTKLAGQRCANGNPQWGYTLFPSLRGGVLDGFSFENGLISFKIKKAQSRRMARWGVGPHDLEGVHQRLLEVVPRNASFKNFITSAVPPAQADGIQTLNDVIDNGSASNPHPLPGPTSVDGETTTTSPWIIEGGRAL